MVVDDKLLEAIHHNLHLLLQRETLQDTETQNVTANQPLLTGLKNFTRLRVFAPTGTNLTVSAYGVSYTYTVGTSSIDCSYPGTITLSTTATTAVPLTLIRDFGRPTN